MKILESGLIIDGWTVRAIYFLSALVIELELINVPLEGLTNKEERLIKKNIAFKCTYNDGGKGFYVGFSGTCSDDILKWNIENGRAWCRDCACLNYYHKGSKGKRPQSPCYESRLFVDWEFGAGWDHYGVRGNVPRKIRNSEEGKVAIITTRRPGDEEKDRKIVGLYKIGELYSDADAETMVRADDDFRIRFPEEEANELFFWDFYKNENGNDCSWGQGLYRYLSDLQVAQILKVVRETIKSEEEKLKIDQLLKEIISGLDTGIIPEPSGARPKKVKRLNVISRNRKYGPGGEGIEHRKLKEWIAKHPDLLGLSKVIKVEIEQHVFPSGDLPDIVFSFGNGMYAVIEIETVDPMPGAYQALKYKALMCAEKGLPITSNRVRSFLIAWDIPKNVRDFCHNYSIEAKEFKI